MDREAWALFQVVFQEAHVVDFDWSEWDRRVRLVVIAGLFGANFHGRGPLHNVDFEDVESVAWLARHRDVRLETPNAHCQWVIMEFSRNRTGALERITLSGFGPTPRLEITCGRVTLSELEATDVDRFNPAWTRAGAPFARPSLDDLARGRHRRG